MLLIKNKFKDIKQITDTLWEGDCFALLWGLFICLHFYLAIPVISYLKSEQFELNMYIVTLGNFQAHPLMGMPDSDTSVRYKIRYRHITKVTDIIALPC